MLNIFRAYLREGLNVAFIMGTGDVIAQIGIEKRTFSEWDKARTARYTALGLIVVGPSLRKWYGFLNSYVSAEQPLIKRGVKKMLLDQLCFAPPFTLFLSFLVPYVNGEQPNKIVENLKATYFDIMKMNYMVWPPAQLFNFSVVPLRYQVTCAQFVAIVWNCYLSTKLNKS